MMNPGSHVTSCFWWFVQALYIAIFIFCYHSERELSLGFGNFPLQAPQRNSALHFPSKKKLIWRVIKSIHICN